MPPKKGKVPKKEKQEAQRRTRVVQSVSRVVVCAKAVTARFASATLVRLSTRCFSSTEKFSPYLYVNEPYALPLASTDVSVPQAASLFEQWRGRMTTCPVPVNLGLVPCCNCAALPMHKAPKCSLGYGSRAILGRPPTRSLAKLRQTGLPATASAHELAKRTPEEYHFKLR